MKQIKALFMLSLLLASSVAQATTTVELYVDTDVSGGLANGSSWANAYSTPQAGINGFGTVNLVTDDKMLILHLRGSTNAVTAITSAPNITNADSTHYLSLIVDTEDRHAGVWSNTKFRISCGSGITYLSGLSGFPAYTVIDGFLVKMIGDGCSGITVSSNYTTIRNCICVSGVRGINIPASKTGTVIQNCIAASTGTGFYASSTAAINSCTAANCSTAGFYVHEGALTLTLRNCYAGGCGTGYSRNVASTMAKTNCYSEDGSESTSTAAFTSSTFVSVTGGSEDLHLVEGSVLIGAGENLASFMNPDDDIVGTSRPQNTTWDVGAFEFVNTSIYASNPSPADDATGQNSAVKLSWTDDAAADSHDLWGGTNQGSLSQLQTASTQEWYVVTGLTPGVPYYWRVDEIDVEDNTTTGAVWTFTPTGKVGARQ